MLICCDCWLQVSQQFDQNVARDPQRLLKVGLQQDAVRHLATGFIARCVMLQATASVAQRKIADQEEGHKPKDSSFIRHIQSRAVPQWRQPLKGLQA